jgi:succinyl-diaminopimelate desuccinylase
VTDRASAVVEHDAADLFGLTRTLCAVPSVSGDEATLTDAIETRVRARASKLSIDRIANNVVVRTNARRARRIILAGHIDTVPVNGNAEPRVEGDVLHGLGAADMKGGLAVLLALTELAAHKDAPHDLTFVWYEGEEVADPHNGLRHLFEVAPDLLSGDLAFLLEPTGGWVEAGCQGTLHARVTVRGERAHTARPWMGRNAIHRAAELLQRVASAESEVVNVDGLEYREALQVVRVEGGVANNVVPDACSFVVNRRFAPSRTVADAEAELRVLLSGTDDIEVVSASPSAAPNLNHPLIAEFVGTLDIAVRPKLGWTDVARFASHGVPALNYGPGDPTLAHTADERVDRGDIEGCFNVLAHFLGLRVVRRARK